MAMKTVFISTILLRDFEIIMEFGGIDRHGRFHGFRTAKYKFPN